MNSPCWDHCEMCDDFICNIHKKHVADCDCEGVEWWYDQDMDPYMTTPAEFELKAGCKSPDQE